MVTLNIQGREYSVTQEQADRYNALFEEMCEKLDALPPAEPGTLSAKANSDFKRVTDFYVPRLRAAVGLDYCSPHTRG